MPEACSNDIYAGVPSTIPVSVCVADSRSLAMPKSTILTTTFADGDIGATDSTRSFAGGATRVAGGDTGATDSSSPRDRKMLSGLRSR